jgi:hypothetical protein
MLLMSIKRVMVLLLVGFAVFFVIEAPGEAATIVKVTADSAGDLFSAAAHSLSKFVKSLV